VIVGSALEAPTVIAGLHDVAVMCQSIEQRTSIIVTTNRSLRFLVIPKSSEDLVSVRVGAARSKTQRLISFSRSARNENGSGRNHGRRKTSDRSDHISISEPVLGESCL
jgi:hypothetical protein